jgi:hypothetical protein
MKTVWIYVNVDAEPGDVDYLRVFTSEEAANRWFEDNDPDGYRLRISGSAIGDDLFCAGSRRAHQTCV